jgi:hypothetical protein
MNGQHPMKQGGQYLVYVICYLLHLAAAHKLTCLMFFRNTLSAWNAELLEKPSEKIIVGLVRSVVWLQKFMFCCLTC